MHGHHLSLVCLCIVDVVLWVTCNSNTEGDDALTQIQPLKFAPHAIKANQWMHLLGWHEEVLDKSPQQWILFSVDRHSRLRSAISAMGKRGKNKKKLWKCCQRIKWDFPVTKWLAGRLVQPNQYIHSFDQCYWIRMFVEHARTHKRMLTCSRTLTRPHNNVCVCVVCLLWFVTIANVMKFILLIISYIFRCHFWCSGWWWFCCLIWLRVKF